VALSIVVGHRRLLSLLTRAALGDTLPPALLFAGPDGVGKRPTARVLAALLNCVSPRKSPPEASPLAETAPALGSDLPCGECTSCRRIARDVHPDIVIVEPGESGTIKIEQVREVIDRTAYRPFEGRKRVVIVDEAHAMMAPAQNALLKTLEEPPSASVFVLVTSIPDALLETVRSRCVTLRFGALSAAEVATVLLRDHGYSESEARAAAAHADGSVGRALAAGGVDLTEARRLAFRLLEQTVRTADPARRLEAAKALTGGKSSSAGERDHLAFCLSALASLVRDLGILSTQPGSRSLANLDLHADLERLARFFGSQRSIDAFSIVDRALAALERNASPKLVADWVGLQL
jgi:DNA polymerase-3 subunit delta'